MASSTIVATKFSPHHHPSLRLIANYVTGRRMAPLTISGLEAKQMMEDLLNPEFIEAVEKLGFTAEAKEKEKRHEKGGVMHVICKTIPKPTQV